MPKFFTERKIIYTFSKSSKTIREKIVFLSITGHSCQLITICFWKSMNRRNYPKLWQGLRDPMSITIIVRMKALVISGRDVSNLNLFRRRDTFYHVVDTLKGILSKLALRSTPKTIPIVVRDTIFTTSKTTLLRRTLSSRRLAGMPKNKQKDTRRFLGILTLRKKISLNGLNFL